MSRLADLAYTHLGIVLTLSSSMLHSDSAACQSDNGIRYGVPNWPHLLVQPSFEERIQSPANPALLERHPIEAPMDLLDLQLTRSVVNVMQCGDWFRSSKVPFTPGQYANGFDRTRMAPDAAA